MGLFDGDPSAADLAARFGLPVLAVVDGSAMAQSFGALVHGLATYRDDVRVIAALANRVAGERHAAMLGQSLRGGVQWLGALPRDAGIAFPERHLGLVQADEIADLDGRIDRAAAALPGEACWLPAPVDFAGHAAPSSAGRDLAGLRIAVARDAAFGFLYPANLDCLRAMGATLAFFSPLADATLPPCDALWLPGGYPELHLDRLAGNHAMRDAIRAHHAAGKAVLAECGGMLYCLEALDDGKGAHAPMLGLMPGRATMQASLAALGLQDMALRAGSLRGHTFHYSRMDTPLSPVTRAKPRRPDRRSPVPAGIAARHLHAFLFPLLARRCRQPVRGMTRPGPAHEDGRFLRRSHITRVARCDKSGAVSHPGIRQAIDGNQRDHDHRQPAQARAAAHARAGGHRHQLRSRNERTRRPRHVRDHAGVPRSLRHGHLRQPVGIEPRRDDPRGAFLHQPAA
jgi:cobyrinic acid a,c-diamide synthase